MVVEADLAVGDHFLVLRQATELVVPAIEDMFHFMGVDADGGIDEGMLPRQRRCRLAGGQIAADGDEGLDACLPGSGDHGRSVLIVAGIVQVGVGVDQHGVFSRMLKKAASFVLVARLPATYPPAYASVAALPAALLTTFLSSLKGGSMQEEKAFGTFSPCAAP